MPAAGDRFGNGLTVRCFIAGEIGDGARVALSRVIGELRPRVAAACGDAAARWAAPRSIHLTLEFLGEVTEEDAGRVAKALDALGREQAVEALISGLGTFPGPGAARILWAGLRSEGGRIEALAVRVRGATAELGLGTRDDKPFRAHLTLARFRRPCDLEHIAPGTESGETGLGRCCIDRLILYRSILGSGGAEHRPLHDVRLGGMPCA